MLDKNLNTMYNKSIVHCIAAIHCLNIGDVNE